MSVIQVYEADAGRFRTQSGRNPWIVWESGLRRYFNTEEEARIYVDAILSEINPTTGEKANRMAEKAPPRGLLKAPPRYGK